MTDEPHYYVAGYTVADDPYCQPNGVLVNHFNLTTTQSFEEIEAELSALAIAQILQATLPNTFSVAHLCAVHKAIFSEIYPWAGQFRQVDIAKGDTVFEAHAAIPENSAAFAKN